MSNWYSQLIKPEWAPPGWLFGPVWSVLYILIFISFSYVFVKTVRGHFPYLVALPFIINLIANLTFTPIQFGLQSNFLAAINIFVVLCSLIWAMVVIYPYAKWVTYINIPYLIWVIFATILQFNITYLNW